MMEKSCHSSAKTINTTRVNSNSNSNGNSNINNSLRLLNKSSHKIFKPTISKPHHNLSTTSTTTTTTATIPNYNSHHQPPPAPPIPPSQAPQQPHQSQPPVYNINKNDFRDVVQKLTGSPAHHHQQQTQRLSSPPPVIPPLKPTPSSRLQKIRPPPLAHLGPRPPPPPPLAPAADLATNVSGIAAGGGGGSGWMRSSPFSPLPPFPTVSAAAESPMSAYMRCLQSGSGVISDGTAAPLQQVLIPSPGSSAVPFPLPLAFGCVSSPRSAAYPLMLSPGLLFPPSPRLPMPSPRWRDL